MRFFNTEGPVRSDDHYAIAPLKRVDVDEFLGPIRAKRYFVLHAPRQTGKTSALIALRDLLNSGPTPPRLPNSVADGRRRESYAWETTPGALLNPARSHAGGVRPR